MRKLKAFTLIELLTVMAITAVLLTLIVLPIFQSFNLTRTAQAFADAQDKARIVVERISREVGQAVSVRDSADTVARLPHVDAQLRPTGTFDDITLPYTKLDLISPAQGDPSKIKNGAYLNPQTGKYDPTMTRPKGDIRLPVAPGMTVTRWWVGLNDPRQPYNEPYTGLLMARGGGRDNLFVLRRAEVQPFIYRLRKDGAANSLAWRPNQDFFRSDDDRGDGGEFDTRIIDLDDPRFFIPDGQYQPETGPRAADPAKNGRVDNWTLHSMVQTEVSRYDMIRPVVTGSPARVVNPNGLDRVIPLIQFRPTRVSNVPAAGSAAARPGDGSDSADRIGPDTYRTDRGLWTNAIVRYYPAEFTPGSVELALVDQLGGVTISNGNYDGSGLDGMHEAPDNFAYFDLKLYERMIARGEPYPFSAAALSADLADLLSNPTPNRRWTSDDVQRKLFMPFRVLTGPGKIVTSFAIDEVGDPTAATKPQPNLPTVTANFTYAVSPTQAGYVSPPPVSTPADPGLATAPVSPVTAGYDINRSFNRMFVNYPGFQGYWQRFIDLRFVPNLDGTYSPLCPVAQAGKVTGFSFTGVSTTGSVNRVRIVPGSETIYGPDQMPGEGYGTTVRYTRVSENPGPNQYRIVYADLPEPTNYNDIGLPGEFATGFDLNNYSPTNLMSAVVQPRFKAGYLQLCSEPNVPVPGAVTGDVTRTGKITVSYRFQFNNPGDSFVVDHDTREVMQILLTVKNYPQSNAPNAQTVTLKATATLRNALR